MTVFKWDVKTDPKPPSMRHKAVLRVVPECAPASSQVRWRSEQEPGGGDPVLALALGHRHRLLLLHLWGRAAEPHRGPPPAAGHSQGQHHPFPLGLYTSKCLLLMLPHQLSDFTLLKSDLFSPVCPALKWGAIFFILMGFFAFCWKQGILLRIFN